AGTIPPQPIPFGRTHESIGLTPPGGPMNHRFRIGMALATAFVVASCSDDAATTSTTTTAPIADSDAVVVGEPFPADRCAANEAAGAINYYTSFDFAAAASIIEVLVASDA